MNTKTLLQRIAFVLISSSLFVSCDDPYETAPESGTEELQTEESSKTKSAEAGKKNKTFVLLGGTQGIFKASELGESFEASNKGLSGNSLIVQAFLQFNSTIYAATKNGVYASKNGGKSWSPSNTGMSGAGLNVVTLFAKGNVIYAGTFGGGVYTSTDGKNWSTRNNGLTGWRLIVRAIVEHDGKIYIGTHNGVYRLSTDGTAWRTITSGLVGTSDRTVVGLASTENSIYAATFGGLLKELKDTSSSWVTLTNGLDDGFVNAVAVVGDKLYVGGNTYGVYVYDGNTFQPFNSGLPSSTLRIRAFAVNGNEVLMSTINSGTYYTTDGVTWIPNSGEPDNADYWGLLLK
jgi:hypothetical protein